jgi:hypothetical protein
MSMAAAPVWPAWNMRAKKSPKIPIPMLTWFAGQVIPFADLVALTELVYPDDDPPSPEAEQGNLLITHGETTEEALSAAGFVLNMDGPLQ